MGSANEVVAYLPQGGSIILDLRNLKGSLACRWFNPREGKFGDQFRVEGGGQRPFQAPSRNDWALQVKG